MILTCLRFDVRPGMVGELEALFARHRIFERAGQMEGCRSLYLAADASRDDRAYVMGVWDDEAAYQRWLDHPEREQGADELHTLMPETWDSSAPGEVWRVLRTTEALPAGTMTAGGRLSAG